jgi:hypothetical protein
MHEEPDVSSWHQVALAAAFFFAGLPQASRRSLDLLGGKGKSPGAARMARLFQWTQPVWNVPGAHRPPLFHKVVSEVWNVSAFKSKSLIERTPHPT